MEDLDQLVAFQIYSDKPINLTHLERNPYEDAAVCTLLKNMGVLFYRDQENAQPALLTKSDDVIEGFYTQAYVNPSTGGIEEGHAVMWNNPCRIRRIDTIGVNREML